MTRAVTRNPSTQGLPKATRAMEMSVRVKKKMTMLRKWSVMRARLLLPRRSSL